MTSTLDDTINNFGFGKFSWKLMLIGGIFNAADSSELTLISLIVPILQCEWKMSFSSASLISSSVLLGMGIGSLYWGWFGDKYGRKKLMIISAVVTLYFGLLSAGSPGYSWFLVLRFFVGIGIGGVLFVPTYVTEFIPTKHRGKAVIASSIWFAFGSAYVTFLAYLLINYAGWRICLLLSTLPVCLYLLLSASFPESVRYLLNTGDHNEIMRILHRISVENEVCTPRDVIVKCQPSNERGNIWILFNKNYRLKTMIMIITWISGLGFYFGFVILNTKVYPQRYFCSINKTVTNTSDGCQKLTDEDYIPNLIVLLGDWPGIIICMILTDIIGRKNILLFGYTIIATCLTILNLCLHVETTTIIMFILKATTAGITQTNLLYAAEIFPNVVRTTSLGILNTVSRWSLIAVPFAFQTLSRPSLVIMITVCLLNIFLCSLLPETNGNDLSNT